MTSPVVTLVINPRSRRKFDRLVSMMEHTRIVLDEARDVVSKLDPQSASRRAVPPDLLLALVKKAEDSLEALEGRVRRGQAELLAQDWRY
ncbi:hypothetical protein GCM10022223_47100 [Kineosporia mesophila]|uniref:Uncharacterized protein n=1 Tax=Kineosporia mesophila TaxID=566012 RepID=A0ABP7A476_9ACTN|nr:hypothetical protein [Kineosporia mesophila]MCD5353818.1 hypothetical protein [Kineosporia mesophila]